MREKLTQGHPEDPLLIYIGRLGVEKKLKNLRRVLEANPAARLAFVGEGPADQELRSHFRNYNVYFAGKMVGKFIVIMTFVMISLFISFIIYFIYYVFMYW